MAPTLRRHSSSRSGAALLLAVGAVGAAVAATGAWQITTGFAAPLRAAAAAGAVLGGVGAVDGAAIADVYGSGVADGSSIQLAKGIDMGGKAGGGLEGTYEMKGQAKKNDFVDDEKALAADEKFEQKFDSYVGVFAILFVGAFIAPMVTYFWYVRDEDPWVN
mmetsp:Transcript_128919/g.334236  ORF Transcript_128919/g.334236 Transcript_128919/m.334236 type:complete len:162 (-) Transcript_128919:73-558(-)